MTDTPNRCAFLCPTHLEPCILRKAHQETACLCQNIAECRVLRQLEEVCWEVRPA